MIAVIKTARMANEEDSGYMDEKVKNHFQLCAREMTVMILVENEGILIVDTDITGHMPPTIFSINATKQLEQAVSQFLSKELEQEREKSDSASQYARRICKFLAVI